VSSLFTPLPQASSVQFQNPRRRPYRDSKRELLVSRRKISGYVFTSLLAGDCLTTNSCSSNCRLKTLS
jgi:hypothetical protein